MGTDDNGADVLSRMIHASRIALSIGFISTGISVAIGIVVGGLMGYFAGRVDIAGHAADRDLRGPPHPVPAADVLPPSSAATST